MLRSVNVTWNICCLTVAGWKSVPCNDHSNPIWIDTVYFGMLPVLGPALKLPRPHRPKRTRLIWPHQDNRVYTEVQRLSQGGGEVYVILGFKPQCVRPQNPLWVMVFWSHLFIYFGFVWFSVQSQSPYSTRHSCPAPSFSSTTQPPWLSLCEMYSMSAWPSVTVCPLCCLAAWVCFVLICILSCHLFWLVCLSLKSTLVCFCHFLYTTSTTLLLTFWSLLHPNKHFNK